MPQSDIDTARIVNTQVLFFFFTCCLVLSFSNASGQKAISIIVVDSLTKKPVRDAAIYFPGTQLTVNSNERGMASLPEAGKSDLLHVQHVTYGTSEYSIPSQDKIVIFAVRKVYDIAILDLSKNDGDYDSASFVIAGLDPSVSRSANYPYGQRGLFDYFYFTISDSVIKSSDKFIKLFASATFTVGSDGQIAQISLAGDTVSGIGQQLRFAISKMKWEPAVQNNTPVEQTFRIVFAFRRPTPAVKFTVIERSAEFVGGMEALQKFLQKNTKTPKGVRITSPISIYVSFIIDRDGSIAPEDVSIAKGGDPRLNEEAIRVVRSFPPWKPGTQNGTAVRCRFFLPVKFGHN